MICGYCKGKHDTTAEVMACHMRNKKAPLPDRTIVKAINSLGEMATPRQAMYVDGLLKERKHNFTPHQADVKTMTKAQASFLIEQLVLMPKVTHDNPETMTGAYLPNIEGNAPDDGRYTVVMPDGRRTIRFYTPRTGKFAGHRLVKFLSGSDNDSDYTTVGQVVEGGVYIWSRHKNMEGLTMRAINFLMRASKEEWADAGETYALESSNCYRCGRTLTVPTSIHRGLGPDCAAK